MAYRSNHIRAAPGVDIVRDNAMSTRSRWRNGVLDVLVLPYVAATRRSRPDVLDGPVPLHYGLRRWDWRTERGLELALAARAVAGVAPADVLEVGNVLAPAGLADGHTIVDKYEVGPGVLNVDIVDFEPDRRFRLAVCVSTLEHVGWDEEPRDPDKAGEALDRIATLADGLFVTIPVGHHRALEDRFVTGPFDDVVLAVRTSRTARWEPRPLAERGSIRYGEPYACGNGVLIGRRRTG